MAQSIDDDAEDRSDDNIVTAWRQAARSSGLLRLKACPAAAAATGVSLSYLEVLAASVRELQQNYDDVPTSTAGLMHHVFLPALARPSGRSRLLTLVPAAFTGKPQRYVCHAWDASFLDLVATLQRELAPDPAPTEPPLPPGFKDGIMLWIDLFAVSQYQPQLAHVIDDNMQRALAAEAEARSRQGMDACSQGILLVVDQGLQCLSRAWCMFEVFHAVYTYGCRRLNVALPELPLRKVFQMRDSATVVDFLKLDTYRTQDKRFLVSEVKRRCGVKRTNALISDALLHALSYKLRWRAGSGWWETATLAAMLLQDDKLLQLQLLLNPLHELKDDEQSLTDMRSLFLAFDKDNSGEIDSWEFVDMLHVAGWSADDALVAFHEVNTDGAGGVSLEEFEQWWMEHLKHEFAEVAVDRSVGGLCTNLERMAAFMGRLQLEEHEEFFRSNMGKVKAAFKNPEQKLPAPSAPLKGDIMATVEHVAQGIAARDLGPQCTEMYDLLGLNHDMMEQSPASLQAPNSVTGLKEQAALLVSYMQHLAAMLRQQLPQSQAHYEYVMDIIAALKTGPIKGTEPKAKGDDPKSFLADRQAFRQGLRARYGGDEFVTPRRVKDLQKAVSQFIANTRNVPRNVALAHPSPTQMLINQDKAASKMLRNRQALPMAMGCDVDIPSLADLRTRLRDDVNKERSLELGLSTSFQARTKPASGTGQYAGPWSKQSVVLEQGPPAMTSPRMTASRASSLPVLALNLPKRVDAETSDRPSRTNSLSLTLPRSKPSTAPRMPCMDDYIDRSMQRTSEDGASRPASSASMLGSCSPRLRAMSTELELLRSKQGSLRQSLSSLPVVRSRQPRPPLSCGSSPNKNVDSGEEDGAVSSRRPSGLDCASQASISRVRSLLSLRGRERLGDSTPGDGMTNGTLHRSSLPGSGSQLPAKAATVHISRRGSLGVSRLAALGSGSGSGG